MRPHLACAVVVAAQLAIGCDGADRREAKSVVSAVARFRRADGASTPAMVQALEKTPCSAPDVCAARDACVASGAATARALVLKKEVEEALAALERGALASDAPAAQALPAKLDEAEALLRTGHDALPACDERVQGLKRRYRI